MNRKPATIEIRDGDGSRPWSWRLLRPNGTTEAEAGKFTSKRSAITAVLRLRRYLNKARWADDGELVGNGKGT